MLKINNLKKNFGSKKVLKGINLEVKKGEIVGIIGPSGCGKSTLLRCINLLETPDSGKLMFEGNNLLDGDSNKDIRRRIGMVFQQFNLFDHKTVLENIILSPVLLKIMSREKAIKKAHELLGEIGLEDIANNYPHELFDEPTSALDPEMIGEVTNLMRKIAKEGMTMIIVSHEMNFIKSFCTRVVFMDDGIIKEDASSKEIFSNPKNEDLKSFLSKINAY